MPEFNSIAATGRIHKLIYPWLFFGVLTCVSTSGHAINEAIVETDLSISIPVLRVGSDYYQVSLSYDSPNWVVASANVIDSSDVISATFEGSTLTINCLVYNDAEYTVTMNLLDAETLTLALGAVGDNPGCSNAAGGGGSVLANVTTWFYMIDVNLEQDMVYQITASEYDMVVLDFIPSEENNTDYPMAAVVDELHNAPHPKLVIAYIDIGQAEEFRTYWQPGVDCGPGPGWLGRQFSGDLLAR